MSHSSQLCHAVSVSTPKFRVSETLDAITRGTLLSSPPRPKSSSPACVCVCTVLHARCPVRVHQCPSYPPPPGRGYRCGFTDAAPGVSLVQLPGGRISPHGTGVGRVGVASLSPPITPGMLCPFVRPFPSPLRCHLGTSAMRRGSGLCACLCFALGGGGRGDPVERVSVWGAQTLHWPRSLHGVGVARCGS